LAPIMTAYIASHFVWTRALDFAAMLTAVGALLWIFVNAGENLEKNIAIRASSRHF
jgi:cyanate permease